MPLNSARKAALYVGPQGPAGPAGSNGADGLGNWTVAAAASVSPPASGATGFFDASNSNQPSVKDSTGRVRPVQYQSYFNVTDPAYGATGNGVTDDTAAIQAAINAAIATGFVNSAFSGACIFFPKGQFLIKSTITQNNVDGLTWQGVGGGSQIIWGGASSTVPMFNIENCYRPSFEHLFFTCVTPLLSVFDLNTLSSHTWINTRAHFQDCHFICGYDLIGGATSNQIFEFGVRCGTNGVSANNDFHYFDHCTFEGYGYAGVLLNDSNIWQVLFKQCVMSGVQSPPFSGSPQAVTNITASTFQIALTSGLPSFTTAKDGPQTLTMALGTTILPGKTIEVTDGSTKVLTQIVSVSTVGSTSTITVVTNALSTLGASGYVVYGSQYAILSADPGGGSGPGGGTYSYENGAVSSHLVADFALGVAGGGSFKISDVDSENSRCFLTTQGQSSSYQKLCLLSNVYFDSAGMSSSSPYLIQFNWGGVLLVQNSVFGNGSIPGAWSYRIGTLADYEFNQIEFNNVLTNTSLADTVSANAQVGVFNYGLPTVRTNCRLFNGSDAIVQPDICLNHRIESPNNLNTAIVCNKHTNKFSCRTTSSVNSALLATIPLPGTSGADYSVGSFDLEVDMHAFGLNINTPRSARIKQSYGWTKYDSNLISAGSSALLSMGTNSGAPPTGYQLSIQTDSGGNNVLIYGYGDSAVSTDIFADATWWFTA